MFEFFLKFPASTWRYAEFVWSSGWPSTLLLLCVFVSLIAIGLSLFRQKLSLVKRLTLAALQLSTIAIALAMLWQPALRIKSMQSGENSVAYMLDTSNSMLKTNTSGVSRLNDAVALLADDNLVRNESFDASLYALAGDIAPIELPLNNQLDAAELVTTRSSIANGLKTVLDMVNDQALAAVVLLSDGADNSADVTSEWWQSIKAAGVPIHTIGYGEVVVPDDVELADVHMDAQAGENSIVTARLRIKHNNYSSIRVRVEAGDELLYAEDINVDPAQAESIHTVRFNSGDEGTKDLQFSLTVPNTESNTINNGQKRVLNTVNQPMRVLYVEGEPRWEYKFIRRALQGHGSVEIVSLLRTSANKFYRQGVESADELSDGFPTTREALFRYNAIIIGSMEAAELSTEQQVNLHDFVSERGGSLLMLAGKNGLADGGWGRSALAAALPSKLSAKLSTNDFSHKRAQAQLTTQGLRTPWLRLADTEAANVEAWSELPELNDVQSVGEPRPGSTVMLTVGADEKPLLVKHRYGQGQSFVLGTSGTWRWQMRLPSENVWHEQFWQQFVSHMAGGALPQISVDDMQAVYRDTDEIPIVVTARDTQFKALNDSELLVTVTTPSGQSIPTTLIADIEKPGRFLGSVTAIENGPYAINIVGAASEETVQTMPLQHWVLKESGTAEKFDTGQRRGFLEKISAATGGRYIDAQEAFDLSEVLAAGNAGITQEKLLPLWNMPLLFLLMFLFKVSEWLLRLRWKRL